MNASRWTLCTISEHARCIRRLNIPDDAARIGAGQWVGVSLPGSRRVRFIDPLARTRGYLRVSSWTTVLG